jgi:hypothetical protein
VKRPLIVDGEIAFVPLGNGPLTALIDASDAHLVGMYNWNSRRAKSGLVYAQGHVLVDGADTVVSLHRFLWNTWGMPGTPVIDHSNTNGLDCRRRNLRAATTQQNNYNARRSISNRSGVKGVGWHQGKWRARVRHEGVSILVGYFDDLAVAAAAVSETRRQLHGEFARDS